MVGIITTPESEIEQKREVKLTNGSGVPTQGTTAGGFSEVVAEFVVPSEQRSGIGVSVPVQMVQLLKPWGSGLVKWVRDATTNDSNKDFTCPASKLWQIKMVWFQIDCTATVGNRVPTIAIAPNGTNFFNVLVGGALTAGNTGVYMSSFTGYTADDASNSYTLSQNAPEVILTPGAILRVWDSAAVDAAADDMTVVLHYIEYDA